MKFTTFFYSNRTAYKFQRNACDDFFIFHQFQQVHMDQFVRDLVELKVF